MNKTLSGPRDITIVPQIRLLGPESSYQIEKWVQENRLEGLFAFTRLHIRYHLALQIALMRRRMQNLLRRFLPSEPSSGHYSEDMEISDEQLNEIARSVGVEEMTEWGVYNRDGDFFLFALIYDLSKHNGVLHGLLERSGATAVSEMDEEAKRYVFEEFLKQFSLRTARTTAREHGGYLSAHDLDDIATICKQLNNEEEDNYVSPDLLNVSTYFCILRFLMLSLEPIALETGEPLTVTALKNDEALQGRYYSNFYFVLHYTGALTRYEAFHMLELWEEGEDTTAAGPTPTLTTFSSGAGFRISYPRKWTIDSTTDPSLPIKLYIYVTPSNTVDAVTVATSDLEPNSALDGFTNLNLEELTSFKDYALISSGEINFADHPACKMVWRAIVPVQLDETVQEMQIKAIQVFVINNDKGYVITYKATPKDFDKYLPQAQEVIDSFEFI